MDKRSHWIIYLQHWGSHYQIQSDHWVDGKRVANIQREWPEERWRDFEWLRGQLRKLYGQPNIPAGGTAIWYIWE